MYGDDDLDEQDILEPIIEEFSIKEDVNLHKIPAPVMQQQASQKGAKKPGVTKKVDQQQFSYVNLKNNYLVRIQSPVPKDEDGEKKNIRDELTPEQMFEMRKISTTE